MGNSELDRVFEDFCAHYGMKINKLSFFLDKIPAAQINGKNEIQGLRNLVSNVSTPGNPELEIIQDQWVEYILTYMGNIDSSVRAQVLTDINGYIEDKVYFVGDQLGPIDVLIYYLLYGIMLKLTFQEKEKYLNFSRWFNNIQQNQHTRLGRVRRHCLNWNRIVDNRFMKAFILRNNCFYKSEKIVVKTNKVIVVVNNGRVHIFI